MADSRRRGLRRNVIAALAGNVGYTASQFVMLLAVSRLTDTETVGEYALALAVTAPVFLLFGVKLRQVWVTDADHSTPASDYLGLRLVTSLLAVAISLAVAWVAGVASLLPLVAAVAGFKAVEAQLDVMYGGMQRHERMDLVRSSLIGRAVIGALTFAATLALTREVTWAVCALSIVTLFFVPHAHRILAALIGAPVRPAISHSRLRPLLLLAAPLGVSVAVGSLTANMPRYALQAHAGSAVLGIYAAVAYVLVATAMVAGALAEAASPRLSNLYASNHLEQFTRLVIRLAFMGSGIGLVGLGVAWAGGPMILGALFGEDYAAGGPALVVLMLAATFQFASLAVGVAVNAMRMFRIQVPLNIGALACSAACVWPLTSWFGLTGAAWSVAITQACLGVAYLVLYLRRIRRLKAS